MAVTQVLFITPDPAQVKSLQEAIFGNGSYNVTQVTEFQTAEELIETTQPDILIIDERMVAGAGLEHICSIQDRFPALPMIQYLIGKNSETASRPLSANFLTYLPVNPASGEIEQALGRAADFRHRLLKWVKAEQKHISDSVNRRLEAIESLRQLGLIVTATLDLDSVLTKVVDAAVELTNAEEGSLLLIDEGSGELYMRAARNFQDEFVRTFRLPVQDSLAGQVINTGKPVIINENIPQKIKTSYLVHTLIYVPLRIQDRILGVLGVDNRRHGHPFSADHINLISTLADYAAIAIENARLYNRTEIERNKLETILTHVGDGVIVIDQNERIMIINQAALAVFKLDKSTTMGKPLQEVFQNVDLLEVIEESKILPGRGEIHLEDGQVLNAQVNPAPGVGMVVTMQDITHLKELDRIKSDFVSTVSHDLRSPLTAILGYTELIERAGPVTTQQREFIRRVQFSVNNITALINDLLDLGRIEAGFDSSKEMVSLSAIATFAIDGLHSRIAEKELKLNTIIPGNLPTVLGNPLRLRQMVHNLIDNAIRYTPKQGTIDVQMQLDGDQVILQVKDSGVGIPPTDQPYIFDKFYRSSNLPFESPGTGLGLAIVKSIVDNHQGRIWVDSAVGRGTTFTIVIPTSNQDI